MAADSPSVFISYSQSEGRWAARIHRRLVDADRGRLDWIYAPLFLEVGSDLLPDIEAQIRNASAVVLLLSDDSATSPWVQTEMDLAKQAGATRIVLCRQGTRLPAWLDEEVLLVFWSALGDRTPVVDRVVARARRAAGLAPHRRGRTWQQRVQRVAPWVLLLGAPVEAYLLACHHRLPEDTLAANAPFLSLEADNRCLEQLVERSERAGLEVDLFASRGFPAVALVPLLEAIGKEGAPASLLIAIEPRLEALEAAQLASLRASLTEAARTIDDLYLPTTLWKLLEGSDQDRATPVSLRFAHAPWPPQPIVGARRPARSEDTASLALARQPWPALARQVRAPADLFRVQERGEVLAIPACEVFEPDGRGPATADAMVALGVNFPDIAAQPTSLWRPSPIPSTGDLTDPQPNGRVQASMAVAAAMGALRWRPGVALPLFATLLAGLLGLIWRPSAMAWLGALLMVAAILVRALTSWDIPLWPVPVLALGYLAARRWVW